MNGLDRETIIFLSIFIGVFAFFIMRYVSLWYFRINEAVALLKRIADKVAPEEPKPAAQPDSLTPQPPQA